MSEERGWIKHKINCISRRKNKLSQGTFIIFTCLVTTVRILSKVCLQEPRSIKYYLAHPKLPNLTKKEVSNFQLIPWEFFQLLNLPIKNLIMEKLIFRKRDWRNCYFGKILFMTIKEWIYNFWLKAIFLQNQKTKNNLNAQQSKVETLSFFKTSATSLKVKEFIHSVVTQGTSFCWTNKIVGIRNSTNKWFSQQSILSEINTIHRWLIFNAN